MLVFIAAAPLVLLATALAVWQSSVAARAAATLVVSFVSVAGAFAYALRLERQERERQRAAEVRRAAAESADHSKDVFLATLSHELRGALTAVIGWLDVARSSLDERTTLVRALDTALRNANQQARIIEDLLDVSRIVAGKFAVRRYPIELGRLAREALEAWQPEAAGKRIELHARVHEPIFVEGDRERLLQVMSNLIGNAIKFNRPGGWVELSLSQAGRDVRLEVSDNGSGIAREAMPHIFERFWQAPSRARRSGLGWGSACRWYTTSSSCTRAASPRRAADRARAPASACCCRGSPSASRRSPPARTSRRRRARACTAWAWWRWTKTRIRSAGCSTCSRGTAR
jgi:signal transduction histidine kinase